jgi:hypothetical protein
MTEMLPAVRIALAATHKPAQDEGARALTLRYAELLDEAAPDKKYVKALRVLDGVVKEQLGFARGPVQEREISEAWDTVRSALAQHSVASDLGPKLLAAMTSIGCTLAGRKEAKGDAPAGKLVALENPLHKARREAAERARGAAS